MSDFNDQYSRLLTEGGQIRSECVEDVLVEAISGKHIFHHPLSPDQLYAVRAPTTEEQNQARVVFVKRLAEAKNNGLHTREEIEDLAVARRLFDPKERMERAQLVKMMDANQRARQMTTDCEQKVILDAEVMKLRQRIVELEVAEEIVFRNSAEAIAEHTRLSFYVSRCTLGGELLNEPVWLTWQDFLGSNDHHLIHAARHAYIRISHGMPVRIIRALARTEQWRSIWRPSKDSGSPPFEGATTSWNKNQQSLIYWSDFYDAIYQHPEPPPEDVIRNDDDLQDWLNQQLVKKRAAAHGTSMPKSPPMMRKGDGSLVPMTKVSETNIPVGTPYKIRTGPKR